MTARVTKEVVIVYKSLPHYRVEFYNQLREALGLLKIDLRVIVGRPYGAELAKNDSGEVPWAEYVDNRVLPFGRRTLVWQPVLKRVRSADLVIVEQANKALVNFVFMSWRRLGGPKLGLWGHGYNRDPSTVSGASEVVKRWFVRRCDWWFAYTASTARYVESCGMQPDRVTTVQNAIDTSILIAAREALSQVEIDTAARSMGVASSNVGVFIGSLYPAKRLRFLIEICDEMRRLVADFEMIIVGDGPDRDLVEVASESRAWLHRIGAATGSELARLTSSAKVMLMPSAVGLAVLDAFALETPLVACGDDHGPEIDYLLSGRNGLRLAADVSAAQFASEVARLFEDRSLLEHLRAGCRESVQAISLEQMVRNFSGGVSQCLGLAEPPTSRLERNSRCM